jgi:hypothetical protein
MQIFKRRDIFVVLIAAIVLPAGILFALSGKYFLKPGIDVLNRGNQNVAIASISDQDSPPPSPPTPPTKLKNPPEIIRAVYLTGWSAGSKNYFNYLDNLLNNTEINAVVIDIKDYSGMVSYASGVQDVVKYKLTNHAISDIDSLVRFLHSKNVYVIGRISVFEDPGYSAAHPELAVYNKEGGLWKDNKGLSWMDPASKDVWEYNMSLARDVFYHGFDEVNFDYVRFPSDGNTENMGFPVWDEKTPMQNIIKEFFQYVRASLPGEKISADLFGLTTVNTDDMGIGQVLESALENFDYVAPMVYPSHYAGGFIGFVNPAEHPYEVIKYSLDRALNRKVALLGRIKDLAIKNSPVKDEASAAELNAVMPAISPNINNITLAKIRPWLQDFDLGTDYTAQMIQQEIQAVKDSLGDDYEGYMMWSPSNIYTTY